MDFWIIIGLLVISIGIYIWYSAIFQDQNSLIYGEIMVGGEIAKTVELSENRIFSLNELPNVSFKVSDGAIAFIESDCPDQICVNNGFLRRSGQISVCLPNLVSLIIRTTENNGNFDTMAH